MTANEGMHHYTKQTLVSALRTVGIAPGDIVFTHVGLGMLGFPEGGGGMSGAALLLDQAFSEVLGPEGTLLVPTYSYSFCKNEPFDPETTPSDVGEFTEYFRTRPGVLRSLDPIFSVAGRGPRTAELFADLPPDCFGRDCIHERLVGIGAKICNIGVGFRYATFIHHAEQRFRVPYRYLKLFFGKMRRGDICTKEGWLYNVRIYGEQGFPDLRRLERSARERGLVASAPAGFGEVTCVSCRDLWELCEEKLREDPWYLATGPADNLIEAEEKRVGKQSFSISLEEAPTMMDIIRSLYRLPRDIVSDGYDAALTALARSFPLRIHRYPTGTECWTWTVPEKWACREARLETLDGRPLFSTKEHPLHVVSYSLPFAGEVTREELLKHLHVHPRDPEAIPFAYKYYERDWGLCCSRKVRERLQDDAYRVHIDSAFSYGSLKVGEMVVNGMSEDSIVLCAHLCHPAQANDGLSGIAVGLEVMRQLQKRVGLRNTYRMLLLPETIGSIAWLSQNAGLIPKLKGGLFLEMLGTSYPFTLQHSLFGSSDCDQCFSLGFRTHAPGGDVTTFHPMNDERQFNSPGVRVPMMALYRFIPKTGFDWPYPEYHSDKDTPAIITNRNLEESVDLILRMIDVLEQNRVPINHFCGEVFCSRFGIHIDWHVDPEGNQALHQTMPLIDGTRTMAEIATRLGISFERVQHVCHELKRHGLITFQGDDRPRFRD
ncbi:MAG TPA: DUF4910 domain-containing protein [Candidatus Ozemobacteraceae bacterium]|nr:DUF4910 domain-containing protein [Candidatus Ozemobacteraceae bacterium]